MLATQHSDLHDVGCPDLIAFIVTRLVHKSYLDPLSLRLPYQRLPPPFTTAPAHPTLAPTIRNPTPRPTLGPPVHLVLVVADHYHLCATDIISKPRDHCCTSVDLPAPTGPGGFAAAGGRGAETALVGGATPIMGNTSASTASLARPANRSM